jgi:aryl-alcohol dehydrogenase-like predicted oxidoreductase
VILAYLTSQPFFVVPILGCKTIAQLNDSMSASDLTLTPAELAYLTAI